MTKFFTFLDRYRKWIMLIGFALIVCYLFTGSKFGIPYLNPKNLKGLSMLINGEFDEELQHMGSMEKFNLYFAYISHLILEITFIILSMISIICSFMNKTFFYSIPFSILLIGIYTSYTDQLEIALYYRIPLTFAFVICLTFELLSKYRDKAIAKFDPIIAKRAERRAERKAAKQAQADAEYKQSPEYRIEQLEKRVQELQAQVKDDNSNDCQ